MSDDKPAPGDPTGDDLLSEVGTLATQNGLDHPPSSGEVPAQARLQPGAKVGRYLILEVLGAGGMGVVYKAYDPDLDRRIALKLLSTGRGSESLADRARDRLLREAQALAQLNHPNVVAAYDVGTLGDDVFVAMELCEGQTLKAWLHDHKPSRRQILEVMVAAGRGIAAAHQVGLIHRDIKPDNLLVGADGRVRVLDFGLARVASAEERPADLATPPPGDLAEQSSGHWLSRPMTVAGALVGTPGYMAPEQYLGGPLDAHTDQYAFCVTLYEALYGRRPFFSRSFRELIEKVTSGEIDPPPPEARVPLRLRRALLKGLAVAKEDRFGSMEALLAELARDPWVARRRILSAVTVALLFAALLGLAWAWQTRRQRLCQGAGEHLAGAWDGSTRQAVERAFGATGRPYAADTFARVAAVLDQRAGEWAGMWTEACEATRLRGEQSERLLDLRMVCLDRRQAELRALTDLFANKCDAQVVDRAVDAVLQLGRLADCADKEALLAAFPPPADAAIRARIAELRERLEMASALQKAGKYRDGLELATQIAKEAEPIGFPPLLAESLLVLGDLQSQIGDAATAEATLKASFSQAALAKDDDTFARAMGVLVFVVGYHEAHHREAIALGPFVEAVILRAGNDPGILATFQDSLGVSHRELGEYPQALGYHERSLAIREKAYGPEDSRIGPSLNNLGIALRRMGRYQEAIPVLRRALGLEERTYGPTHPNVGYATLNLGNVFFEQGDLVGAADHYRRALGIWEASLGPEHPTTAVAIYNLGCVLLESRNYKEARETLLRALGIREKVLGAGHPAVALCLQSLGDTARGSGDCRQALAYYQRSIAIREQISGPDHPLLALSLAGEAECLTTLGRRAEAIALLERALQIQRAHPGEPGDIAPTQFALAQALLPSGQALSLAREALENFTTAGAGKQAQRAEVEAWLRARQKP